jgi:hypothetical protein
VNEKRVTMARVRRELWRDHMGQEKCEDEDAGWCGFPADIACRRSWAGIQ